MTMFVDDRRMKGHAPTDDRLVIKASLASDVIESLKVNQIEASDFYLTLPTEADVKSLAELVNNKSFFFAPFNNEISKTKPPFVAAAQVIFGSTTEIPTHTFAVRLHGSNQFVGCVRFENIGHKKCELSYLFDPKHYQKGLGTHAVLRAVHWLAHEMPNDFEVRKKLGHPKHIIASVDPNNIPSYKILTRAGLHVVTGGFSLPENTPYLDQQGHPASRLIMSAKLPQEIIPALVEARRNSHYSLDTPLVA